MTKYIRDYYKILGVKKTADQKRINRAYKRKTKKYYSNVKKDNKTKNKYKLIQEAYTILSDKNKRAKYDKLYEQAQQKDKNKKTDIFDTINTIQDLKNTSGPMTNGLNMIIKSMKSQPLLTGGKFLLGSAVAGYGIKKGRNYMKGRK